MIYPIVWMIGASLKETSEVFTTLNLFPVKMHWENYISGWGNSKSGYWFGLYFLNSLKLSLVVTFGNMLASSFVAFGLARIPFRFRGFWMAILIITLLLPSQATLIPRYILFYRLGWVDTYLPFYAPAFLGGYTFFIFLMVQFIKGIPLELDESAKIDGCGYFRIYAQIVMPLCKPALVTVGIFSFIWSWDNFLGQLIYLNSPAKYTVALGLRLFNDNAAATAYGQLFAMSVLSLLPCFLLFFLAQRYLAEGVATTSGGIKG